MGIEQLTISDGSWESLLECYRDECGMKVAKGRVAGGRRRWGTVGIMGGGGHGSGGTRNDANYAAKGEVGVAEKQERHYSVSYRT